MKIKVSNASGTVLDWLVAKCEETRTHYQDYRTEDGQLHVMYCDIWLSTAYAPSTNWAQGGPLIEREHLEVSPTFSNTAWVAGYPNNPSSKQYWSNGRTPLIAALRCYVVSKLGEEVEVPDELA